MSRLGNLVTKNIIKCQNDLENNFKNNQPKIIKNAQVNLLHGTFYYFEGFDIWYYPEKMDNRYRNAFGLGTPQQSTYSDIQINIPFDGENKRIAGKFVEENNGKIWLCHNGNVNGAKKIDFLNHFNTWKINHQGDKRKLVKVCNLDSDNFVKNLKEFVEEVRYFKK